MACHSNAASTMDNWLSSKNSHDQTIRAHMEKDITSEASNRGIERQLSICQIFLTILMISNYYDLIKQHV